MRPARVAYVCRFVMFLGVRLLSGETGHFSANRNCCVVRFLCLFSWARPGLRNPAAQTHYLDPKVGKYGLLGLVFEVAGC